MHMSSMVANKDLLPTGEIQIDINKELLVKSLVSISEKLWHF